MLWAYRTIQRLPTGEQDRGRYRGLLGSADPSVEVRQRSELMMESGSRRSLGGVLLVVEVVSGVRLP